MGIVYILQSEVNNRFYIGSTNNLIRRLKEHNSGNSRYTKFTIPFKIVFHQEFDTLEKARKIEYKLKKYKSKKIIERIIKEGYIRARSSVG